DYLNLFAVGFPIETEVSVMLDLLTYATARPGDGHRPHAGIVPRYLADADLPAAEAVVADACVTAMRVAPSGGGRQLIAARGVAYAAGPDRVELLRGWLGGSGIPDGLEMDAELRWIVLTRLAMLGAAGRADIEAEAKRDPTASGAERAACCRAAVNDEQAK